MSSDPLVDACKVIAGTKVVDGAEEGAVLLTRDAWGAAYPASGMFVGDLTWDFHGMTIVRPDDAGTVWVPYSSIAYVEIGPGRSEDTPSEDSL